MCEEPESEALRRWFVSDAQPKVTSDISRTELIRAVRRARPDLIQQARVVLDSFAIIVLTTSIFEEASRLMPSYLRSLDALHIAAALNLGDSLGGFVTYDKRQAEAVEQCGVPCFTPSVSS